MRTRGLGGALFAGGLAALGWSGCTATKPTELVPGVETQIQVPKDLLAIRIDVQAEGESSNCIVHSVNPNNPGFITLPTTLGVVPGAGPNRPVTITVTGFSKDDGEAPATTDCTISVQRSDGSYDPDVRVLRRSRLTYVGDETLFLPMNLRFSCWDASACQPDQTCKAGLCVDDTVDPTTLPPYSDGLVNGAGNTCFSVEQCFLDGQDAKVIDQAKCVYGFVVPPPASLAKGVNVRVFYGQDGGESEVLDLDPVEGFTIDPTNGQQAILSPGLCALVNAPPNAAHHIYEVDISGVCSSKGVYQPLCTADSVAGAPVPLPDGGTSADGGCNVAQELVPAPSALYVLMDDSSSMQTYFGMQGLQTVTGLTLSDPVFRSAQFAFTLLPHAPNDCTAASNSVETPLVPFTTATMAQSQVATIIGNAGNVKGADPKWYVDAALRPNGAYGALAALPAAGTAFNRMAVLLIANRQAAASPSDCNFGMNASDEAATALAATPSIFTYVVALPDPSGAYDTTELSNIATSGGTTIFDATSNMTVGETAFNAVETDLGSCLYEKPANADMQAVVSYTDPIFFQTANVAFNASCTAATATTGSGWNFDGNLVRICGQDCTSLRTVLSNTANAFLAQMKPAPDVPVVFTEPCAAPMH